MKPAAFEYHDPRTAEEALALLAQYGDEAKALAGGQSLVPLMNFRLARPARLVDLNLIGELSYLRVERGTLRIGAMTRQRELERASLVAEGWPLLAEATRYIGHAQIRNRGTVGGSLAHADPAAELPAVMAALDAELVIQGRDGTRTVQSEEFFLSYLTTALAPDELLVETRVPALPPRTGWAFVEVSRRHGDFALVGVAALLTLDTDGMIQAARLAFTGAAPTPVRAARAEALLVGERPAEPLFREAGLLASADLEPEDDLHASADYRREVGGVLARRALVQAAARAGERRAR
jgi:aerobic carbon-monoxide dehydrogenase medium subunit